MVVAERELSDIAVQMMLGAVLVRTSHAAFEYAEEDSATSLSHIY
jgi:hypothetical protein